MVQLKASCTKRTTDVIYVIYTHELILMHFSSTMAVHGALKVGHSPWGLQRAALRCLPAHKNAVMVHKVRCSQGGLGSC